MKNTLLKDLLNDINTRIKVVEGEKYDTRRSHTEKGRSTWSLIDEALEPILADYLFLSSSFYWTVGFADSMTLESGLHISYELQKLIDFDVDIKEDKRFTGIDNVGKLLSVKVSIADKVSHIINDDMTLHECYKSLFIASHQLTILDQEKGIKKLEEEIAQKRQYIEQNQVKLKIIQETL